MDKNDQSNQDFGTYLLWGLISGLLFGLIVDNIGLGVVLGLLVASGWYSYKEKGGHRSKKLSRSKDNQMIAGVCGGIARYYELDPSVVRISYAVFTLLTGLWAGVLLYLFLFILMHEEG